MSLPAPKQLKFTSGIVNGSVRESATFLDETRKVNIPLHTLLYTYTYTHTRVSFSCKVVMFLYSDDTNRAFVTKEASSCRASWKTLEVEEKPPSMVVAVQMEVAKAMETLRMDQAQ